MDGTVVSDGPHAYLERYCGVGDGNLDQDSGWREAAIDLPLASGVHALTVGGDLKKTGPIEIVNVYFDDLRITPDANAFPPESYCEDGVDTDGDGLIDCEDPDCQQRSTCAGGGEANAVPVVSAGPDQTIEVSETAVLRHRRR